MSGVFNCLEDKWAAEGAERRVAPPASSASLSKESQLHNSVPEKFNELRGSHRKTAYAIEVEIKGLAQEFGIERIGFLTLTFPYQIRDLREAQRRFKSLQTNVLTKRYIRGMVIRERHRRGGIHFHLVVVLGADIRTGVDFEEFKKGKGHYGSAGAALRAEWAFLGKTLKGYKFGRHELLPIKSNAEGVSKYAGKYIGKHITLREPADKGAHLVTYFNYPPGARQASSHLAWVTGPSRVWRLKLKDFVAGLHLKEYSDLRKLFGPRWAYRCQEQIMNVILSDEVIRKFNLLEESKGLVTAFAGHRTNAKKGTDRSGADHPNVSTATPQGSSPGAAAVEGVYTVPTTTQGGGQSAGGAQNPAGFFSHASGPRCQERRRGRVNAADDKSKRVSVSARGQEFSRFG